MGLVAIDSNRWDAEFTFFGCFGIGHLYRNEKRLSAIDFAVSSVFGAVVMYDAMGFASSAGEIAVEVNDFDEQVERLLSSILAIPCQET